MIAARLDRAAKNADCLNQPYLARGLEKRKCLTLPLRALDTSFEGG
jgi:hypothetical protein